MIVFVPEMKTDMDSWTIISDVYLNEDAGWRCVERTVEILVEYNKVIHGSFDMINRVFEYKFEIGNVHTVKYRVSGRLLV